VTDYKKYSLGQIENFLYDAMSTDVTPQEIYDVIKGVVEDNYHTYKKQTENAYELLSLLNGNGKGHIPAYDEYVEKKEHLVCDKDNSSEECKKSWNDFWEVWEENYYPEEVEDNGMRPWGHSDIEYCIANKKDTEEIRKAGGYDWTPEVKKDKVKKWVLPVEVVRDEDTDKDEYCITFPEDLLEAANLNEGDRVEWVDNGDGSYLIKKVN